MRLSVCNARLDSHKLNDCMDDCAVETHQITGCRTSTFQLSQEVAVMHSAVLCPLQMITATYKCMDTRSTNACIEVSLQ